MELTEDDRKLGQQLVQAALAKMMEVKQVMNAGREAVLQLGPGAPQEPPHKAQPLGVR